MGMNDAELDEQNCCPVAAACNGQMKGVDVLTIATDASELALLQISKTPPKLHAKVVFIELLCVLYVENTNIQHQDSALVLLRPR